MKTLLLLHNLKTHNGISGSIIAFRSESWFLKNIGCIQDLDQEVKENLKSKIDKYLDCFYIKQVKKKIIDLFMVKKISPNDPFHVS